MKWVKASDRLPEVLFGESETFFCKNLKDGRKRVYFYGKSGQSYLASQPYNWEWLDEEKIKYPPYLHDLIPIERKKEGEDWIPNWNSPEYIERLKSLNSSLTGITPSGANSIENTTQ